MKKVYILSHTDLDGYFSGGLVQFYFGKYIAEQYECDADNNITKRNYSKGYSAELQYFSEEVEYKHKSWTYGRKLPTAKSIIDGYDYVFIVDLCPDDFSFMTDLYDHFKEKLVWIDHHVKPDTEFLKQFTAKYPNEQINGLVADREHEMCAAYLTYVYFEKTYNKADPNRYEDIPDWLQLISDFDCWNRDSEVRWQNRIMPYFSYLKGEVTTPAQAYDYIIQRWLTKSYYNIQDRTSSTFTIQHSCKSVTEKEIKEGTAMYKMLKDIYKAEAKHGFERNISVVQAGEHKMLHAWICNTQNRSSVIFEEMENIDDYDVLIPYHFNGEKYFYSMYTFKDDIKCNQISVLDSNNNVVLTFNGHDDAAGANSEIFAFPKY